MNHAEGVEVRQAEEGVQVNHQRKTHDLSEVEEPERSRRVAIWYLRHCFLLQVYKIRTGTRARLHGSLLFIVRKIWSLGGLAAARRSGYWVEFERGHDTSQLSEAALNAFYLDVGCTTHITDDCVDETQQKAADVENLAKMDALIAKFPRLTVRLGYSVAVGSPKYQQRYQRGTKRSYVVALSRESDERRSDGPVEDVHASSLNNTISFSVVQPERNPVLPWDKIREK